MRFEKWQALGNDYLIVEREELPFELTPARVRRLCEGHFGVFADGVLELSRPKDPANVADLRIFNPDGSEAELSGNGAREAIMYLRHRGWTEDDEFSISTAAGPIRPQITGPHTCRVDMGRASLTSKDFPGGPPDGRGELPIDNPELATVSFQHVSIGNPQCAIHVTSLAALDALDLSVFGPQIEGHERFPNRTNVSWYTEIETPDPTVQAGAGSNQSADLRARRGGDVVLGHRRHRRRGAHTVTQPGEGPVSRARTSGRAGRRRAGGRGGGGSARESDRLGETRVRGSLE